MRTIAPWLWFAALSAGVLGCDNNLPVANFVDKLRVLAVQASPPEVAPEASSALGVLAVEPAHPEGPTAALSALWLACRIPPGVSSPLPCGLSSGELDGTALPTSCGDSVGGDLCILSTAMDATLKPAASFLGGDISAEILLTVVVADTGAGAAACLLDTARNNGLPTEPDHCVISIKRVTVRDPSRSDADHPIAAPNANPSLDRLDLVDDDGTVRSLLAGDAAIPAAASDGAVSRKLTTVRGESAAEQKPDGSYEALSLSWFTTGGKIDGGRSTFDPPGCDSQAACAAVPPVTGADTTWNAPTSAEATSQVDSDGRLRFWAVLRDDRGGVGWVVGTLGVQ